MGQGLLKLRNAAIFLIHAAALPLFVGCAEGVFETTGNQVTGQSLLEIMGEDWMPEHSEDGRYIVSFNPSLQMMPKADPMHGVEAELLVDIPGSPSAAYHLADEAIQQLIAMPEVSWIEPDPRRELLGNPSDSQVMPYGMSLVQAPEVWARTDWDALDGDEITVCVIDSGFDLGHPNLQTENVTGSPSDWNRDGCGHGTHVAGTIAALDNDVGVVGVMPQNVRLHIVKVFGDHCGWSYASELIGAVRECMDAGANVINMSLSGAFSIEEEREVLRNAYERGVLLVAAAGNNGTSGLSYPASYDSVISVAAVNSAKRRWEASQNNDRVELAAPGVEVLSTVPRDGCLVCEEPNYESWDGTSMATPHVAGAAALLWSHNPAWSNRDIRAALVETAQDLGLPGRNPEYGHGLIQVDAALEHLLLHGEPFEEPGTDLPEDAIPAEHIVTYDFEGETRAPSYAADEITAGPFGSFSGECDFAVGNPGNAVIDSGWRDEDNNYFQFHITNPLDNLIPTKLIFDARASPAGPTEFEVELVSNSEQRVASGQMTITPGSWQSHVVDLEANGAMMQPGGYSFGVRISAGGATHVDGTLRVDNVRLEGRFESIEDDDSNAHDGTEMIVVPSGPFMMGCTFEQDPQCNVYSEGPPREVHVPSFEIGKYPVTAAQYRDCVNADICRYPSSYSDNCNFYLPHADQHPINCITWEQARDYCEWSGKRLCTEAEWEKAARGTDGRKYPWGNEPLSCDRAVFSRIEGVVDLDCGISTTQPVGSKPAGASPYGVNDMVGNVFEWVKDNFSDGYEGAPTDGSAHIDDWSNEQYFRVKRGGSFDSAYDWMLRSAYRGHGFYGLVGNDSVGVRCCK